MLLVELCSALTPNKQIQHEAAAEQWHIEEEAQARVVAICECNEKKRQEQKAKEEEEWKRKEEEDRVNREKALEAWKQQLLASHCHNPFPTLSPI